MIETWIESKISLSDAPDRAINNRFGIVDITPRTIKWMRYATTRLIKFSGDIEINIISPNHIADWQQYEMSREVSPYTVNSYLGAIKTMFTRLQRNGTTGSNPAEPIILWPVPTPTPKAIAEADYQTILNQTTDPRNRAILATLWATGCRLGGLVSMRIDKIETTAAADGTVRHAFYIMEKGRNGKQKPRWVYSKGRESRIIQEWITMRPSTRTPALFTIARKNGYPITKTAVNQLFHKIHQQHPHIQHANPHAFRHAFAIRKLDEGYDLPLVSKWLGHHSPEYTARIYVIRSEDQLRHAYYLDE